MFVSSCSGFSQSDWIVNVEKRNKKLLIVVRFPDRTEGFDTFYHFCNRKSVTDLSLPAIIHK